MTQIKTTTRTVKYIPYGEYYPRNLIVSIPYVEFLEKVPLWETQWWFEQTNKSSVARLIEKSGGEVKASKPLKQK